MNNLKSKMIAFFSIITNDSGSYVGAILVTDHMGIPKEFKCTQSIKPTQVQKSLYGSSLIPFISNELCGKVLLDNLSNKPEIIFVENDFQNALSNFINNTVVHITKKDSELLDKNEGNILKNKDLKYEPIIISIDNKPKESQKEILELSQKLFLNFDLMEAFDRVHEAIDLIKELDPEKYS